MEITDREIKDMEYKVIEGEGGPYDSSIGPQVNKAIKEGWEPLGGIATSKAGMGVIYSQAMVRGHHTMNVQASFDSTHQHTLPINPRLGKERE